MVQVCKKTVRFFVFSLSVLIFVNYFPSDIAYSETDKGDILQISSGYCFNLALLTDGTVWAWGDNTYGQLADGTTGNGMFSENYRAKPQRISELTDVTSISAGSEFSIALKRDGTVWSWGHGNMGQLGNIENINVSPIDIQTNWIKYDETKPVQVKNLDNVMAVSAGGAHTLALKRDGTVWAWGNNMSGEVGSGDSHSKHSTAVQVIGLSDVIQIAAGINYSLALKKDGTVWAWGLNKDGSLGTGLINEGSFAPVQIKKMSNIKAIMTLGRASSIAISKDGSVYQWGSDLFKLKGSDHSFVHSVPELVPQLTNVKTILLSSQSNYADHSVIILKNDGSIWGLGKNNLGQLGNGSNEDQSEMTLNSKINSIIQVSGNRYYYDGTHTVALDNNGNAWAWGFNQVGQVGPGGWSFNDPIKVSIPSIIKVRLNGDILSFQQYPEIINGTTMVPLRKIFESLGATIHWESTTQSISASRGNVTVKLSVNSDTAYINDEKVLLDQVPVIKNELTLVPLRFITESFGGQVIWDENNKLIDLKIH
ncbi:stalk domain-containing protein [Paenibacillus sp. LjRoot56]|uniref:RCC1 domain-containing protein n=1 Tax=Paenibacillus sp. LjRoot56 TaxID=3342333 RepID=UPI003ED0316F